MHKVLIQPLQQDLEQAGVETIIYAPDAQLRYIPLASLYDGQQWLIEQYRVNNITARAIENLEKQPQAQPRVLAAASTQAHQVEVGGQPFNFNPLPYAGVEVDNLEQVLDRTTKIVDQDFNLTKVRPLMRINNVLHFATHAAFVPGDPENSFMLFGDGSISTLRDIESWVLNNVDLVVLSACETGVAIDSRGELALEDGREILGLGYQFQKVGARATVASLWKVDDGGTQALMTAFYAALQQGFSKAEALQVAQRALITGDFAAVSNERGTIDVTLKAPEDGQALAGSDNLAHPYYWSPFILIGNGL